MLFKFLEIERSRIKTELSCIYPFKACYKSNICVNSIYFCDGQNDCPSGEDEENCGEIKSEIFYCILNTTQAISFTKVCDFIEDCPDASDEIHCGLSTFLFRFFKCFFFSFEIQKD